MTGFIEDPRTKEEKDRDWKRSEVFGYVAHSWKTIPEKEWPVYPEHDQANSFMCMGFSGAMALGINEKNENGTFLDLSALFIYLSRFNYPDAGMWLQNLLAIMRDKGTCLDKTLPSDKLTEAEANNAVLNAEMTKEALRFKGKAYFVLTTLDEIASAISNGYGVILTIKASVNEWTDYIPEIIKGTTEEQMNVRHGICAVLATVYKGEKALVIYDSAMKSSTKKGRRILTESFLKERLVQAGYVTDTKTEDIVKPKYHFAIPLVYGDMNAQVTKMQQVLQYEKFLVTHVEGVPLPLGRFGPMTASALKKWQIAHQVAPLAELEKLGGRRFGEKSIAMANSLYN